MGKYTFDTSMTKREKEIVANWPPEGVGWQRRAVGGHWNENGERQLLFLKSHGLKSVNKLLDIGCGSLRAGVRFIDYLEEGCYYGIDNDRNILREAAVLELPRYNLENKKATIVYVENFDLPFEPPVGGFNFMMAQSVFTHLAPPEIRMCLKKMTPLLSRGGRVFATFNKSERPDVIRCGNKYPTMSYYPTKWFKELAQDLGIKMDYIGDWGHPANKRNDQLMLCFSCG